LADTILPEITCPDDTVIVLSDEAADVCIRLVITDYDSVSVAGATWSADQLCFHGCPGNTYVFIIAAFNDCGSDRCEVVIAVKAAGMLYVDIRPRSCPNPLNVRESDEDGITDHRFARIGPLDDTRAPVLPVAILGTAAFDVRNVDLSTVMLEGVRPLRWRFEDVSTPADDTADCACTTEGADGYNDVTLKFDKQSIVDALGEVYDGEVIPLTLTCELVHGEPIQGVDCVIIRGDTRGLEQVSSTTDDSRLATLYGNFPNPFNTATAISFRLSEAVNVRVDVYNILGKCIATLVDQQLGAGPHCIEWQGVNAFGRSVASGVYFYVIEVGDQRYTRKMLLLK
jgi:hypothetical protein